MHMYMSRALLSRRYFNDGNCPGKIIFPKYVISHYSANLFVVRYQYTTFQINKNTFEKEKKSLTAVIAETYRYK